MRVIAELVRTSAAASRNYARMVTTTASDTAASSAGTPAPKIMLQVPAWGLVGIGTAAAGFFGKILHDDNLETRRELRATRSELREDIKELREDNKELRKDMNAGFENITRVITSLKPGHGK